MNKPSFNTIAIVARDTDPEVQATVNVVIQLLLGRKLQVWVADHTKFSKIKGVHSCAETQLSDHCDLFTAVGGDGTMLQAAHLSGRANLPVFGVNKGRRGFLADIHPERVETTINDILDGHYLAESRMMLSATLVDAQGDRQVMQAFNDVVVQRGAMGQMLDFEVRVDGAYVNTHRGDGLIIATPTGSTAYALSSGGPIMQPGLNAVAMVPICPHTLSDRPVVIPGNSIIDVKIKPRFDADAFVTVDGKMIGEVDTPDSLQVTQAINRITLLHPQDYDYFEVLRSKLNWGNYGSQEKA